MRSMFLILNQKIEGIKKIRVDNVLAITYNSIRRKQRNNGKYNT